MPLPAGLSYLDDYVSAGEASALLSCVDAEPWMSDLRRRVQHYGYRYDYRARSIDRSMYLGPLPAWSRFVVQRLCAEAIFDAVPDQLIVNEYEPGQGITPHVDCIPCFGPVVASLSLGSACQMDLSRDAVSDSIALRLRPCSLLILSGEARTEWRHGIRSRRSDTYQGTRVPRGRRVSLTFRTVRMAGA